MKLSKQQVQKEEVFFPLKVFMLAQDFAGLVLFCGKARGRISPLQWEVYVFRVMVFGAILSNRTPERIFLIIAETMESLSRVRL